MYSTKRHLLKTFTRVVTPNLFSATYQVRHMQSYVQPQHARYKGYEGYTIIQEAGAFFAQKAVSSVERMNVEINQDIIVEAYEQAIANQTQESHLFRIIRAIPTDLTLTDKLGWFVEQLNKYPAMPVITAHPTRVISNEKAMLLCAIVDMLPRQHKAVLSPKEKVDVVRLIREFMQGKLVPEKNLTADDEAAFALFLYQRMLASFPEFFHEVVQEFMRVHGGEYTEVATHLKPALMQSFRLASSWCMADFDGNKNRTRKTLEKTVPSQQKAIIALYIARLKAILNKLDINQHVLEVSTLRSTQEYFERCIEAIEAGILFDVKGSEKAKQRVLKNLDEVIASFDRRGMVHANADMVREVAGLKDLIDLGGFFGGLKEYTRQTTKLNQRVLHNLLTLLKAEYPAIERMMGNKHFGELSAEIRHDILTALRQKTRYFQYLKENAQLFNEETTQEIARLSFILGHNDIFSRYICSDTEDKVNLEEMLLLFHFSAYMTNQLHIGQIRQYPVNPMILCETPDDIRDIQEILTQIYEDPAIRAVLAKMGVFSYVGGPSDLGKLGGLMMYFALLRAALNAAKTLDAYKTYDEKLVRVLLWVLNGFGGDFKRRNGSSALELHATHQGQDALKNLGATGAYRGFLHRVIGHAPETFYRAQELVNLQEKHPKAYSALTVIDAACVSSYQALITSPHNKALLSRLTSFELERAANISSRAGAKAKLEDPTNVRAIGVFNLYLITGVLWDIFMSLGGLIELPEQTTSHMGTLVNELTTMKDIVYKVWFSIAVSDFEDAWVRIHGEKPTKEALVLWREQYVSGDMAEENVQKCTLAHIEYTARELLTKSMGFFPDAEQTIAKAYLAKSENLSTNQLALGLMCLFNEGDIKRLAEDTKALLPRFKRLRDAVKAYEENPTDETKEVAVKALRGGTWITGGPATIESLISPLHLQAILGDGCEYEQAASCQLKV